jgi:hypothetical protein
MMNHLRLSGTLLSADCIGVGMRGGARSRTRYVVHSTYRVDHSSELCPNQMVSGYPSREKFCSIGLEESSCIVKELCNRLVLMQLQVEAAKSLFSVWWHSECINRL